MRHFYDEKKIKENLPPNLPSLKNYGKDVLDNNSIENTISRVYGCSTVPTTRT